MTSYKTLPWALRNMLYWTRFSAGFITLAVVNPCKNFNPSLPVTSMITLLDRYVIGLDVAPKNLLE
jgi:hypothetical protein